MTQIPDDISIECTIKSCQKLAQDANAVGAKDQARMWSEAAQIIDALAKEITRLKVELYKWREGEYQP